MEDPEQIGYINLDREEYSSSYIPDIIVTTVCIGGDHWDGGPGADGIHPPGQGGEALQ